MRKAFSVGPGRILTDAPASRTADHRLSAGCPAHALTGCRTARLVGTDTGLLAELQPPFESETNCKVDVFLIQARSHDARFVAEVGVAMMLGVLLMVNLLINFWQQR